MSKQNAHSKFILALALFHRYGWLIALFIAVQLFPHHLLDLLSVFFIAFALQQPLLLKAAQHGGNARGRHIQPAAQLSRGQLLPAVMQKPHHRHLAAQGRAEPIIPRFPRMLVEQTNQLFRQLRIPNHAIPPFC